ncbi:MAG: metallophosphoesterase [Steroidobacterales bacterium]
METNGLIRPLFSGRLDIIGDVHGEAEALGELLGKLGYDRHGAHPDGRRLVFVGDLCDRGPDSPAVIELVRNLVAARRAQCVVGNHELNLLRNEVKHGNGWYHGKHEEAYGVVTRVTPEAAREIAEFLLSLPVALEREDLRLVHAAWIPKDIEACRAWRGSVLDAYEEFDRLAHESPEGQRLVAASRAEKHEYPIRAIHASSPQPPFLHNIAAYEEYYQMSNPVRVLTSGVERITTSPFYAGGKWRFVARVRWWEHYFGAAPVVFGHYWRWWHPDSHARFSKGEPNLFDKEPACGWHHNRDGREVAFCVDYSAGARFKERKEPRTGPFHGRLAALRWPEKDLLFDQGDPVPHDAAMR